VIIDDFDTGPMHAPLGHPDDTLIVLDHETDINRQSGLPTDHVIGGNRELYLIGQSGEGSANAQIWTDLRYNNDVDFMSRLEVT